MAIFFIDFGRSWHFSYSPVLTIELSRKKWEYFSTFSTMRWSSLI